jgi:hypothetical protein
MPSAVSWRYDHTTERWLRWCLLAGVAALFGAYALALAGAAVSLLLALVAGSTGLRLLVALLVLVGGPFSLLYLLPLLRDPDQRPRLLAGNADGSILTRERVVAGVLGAVVLAASFRVEPHLGIGLFLVGALAGLVAVCCSTRGRIDPGTATAETGSREWDLSRVTGYTTRRAGPLAVVSLHASGPGRFGTVPSWILVPVPALEDAAAALDAVAAGAEAGTDREPNPAVRAVAVGLAVISAAGGLAAALFVELVGWYAAAIGLLFAAVFLLVAREG